MISSEPATVISIEVRTHHNMITGARGVQNELVLARGVSQPSEQGDRCLCFSSERVLGLLLSVDRSQVLGSITPTQGGTCTDTALRRWLRGTVVACCVYWRVRL